MLDAIIIDFCLFCTKLAHWSTDDQGFPIMEHLCSIDNGIMAFGKCHDGHTKY
jgi:hypothetical protein